MTTLEKNLDGRIVKEEWKTGKGRRFACSTCACSGALQSTDQTLACNEYIKAGPTSHKCRVWTLWNERRQASERVLCAFYNNSHSAWLVQTITCYIVPKIFSHRRYWLTMRHSLHVETMCPFFHSPVSSFETAKKTRPFILPSCRIRTTLYTQLDWSQNYQTIWKKILWGGFGCTSPPINPRWR